MKKEKISDTQIEEINQIAACHVLENSFSKAIMP